MNIELKNEKPLWSFSRVSSFGHCKYEYYLNYILKDWELYPRENNYYAELGGFVHSILEKIFKKELTLDEAIKYYIKNYKFNVKTKVKKSTMDKNFDILADYFAELDLDWLQKYEILGAELKERFTVGENEFIGFIDLLLRDKTDGRIVVLDHKSSPYPFGATGKVLKNSEKSFNSYKKQMYLYCHSVWQQFGEFPKSIVWNHFKAGGRFASIPFIKSEYEDTIKWFENEIKKIEHEVNFDAKPDYFYCTTLCNFRSSCEYCKELKRKFYKK